MFTVPARFTPTLAEAATPPEDSWDMMVWVAELSTTMPVLFSSLRLELSPSLVTATVSSSALKILSSFGLDTLMASPSAAAREPPFTSALVLPVILLVDTDVPKAARVLAPMLKPPAKL